MSENEKSNDTPNDTPKERKKKLSHPGRLEIKKTIDAGRVRQSFPHGRSRSVAVEVKRKRTYAQDAGGKMQVVKREEPLPVVEEPLAPSVESKDKKEVLPSDSPSKTAPGALTEQERATRARALRESAQVESLPSQPYAEKIEPPPLETPLSAGEPTPEPTTESTTEPTTEPIKESVKDKQALDMSPSLPSEVALSSEASLSQKEERRSAKKDKSETRKPSSKGRSTSPRRREGKLTITQALDERERMRSLAAVRRAREREKSKQKSPESTGEPGQKKIREIIIPETLSVSDLANRMATRSSDVIKTLMKMGVMATVNQVIDSDTAELVVVELGHTARRVSDADVEIGLSGGVDEAQNLVARPPVVTVMGHVDHGKTSLLDSLRTTRIASGEAGGITQHIGAYQIETESGDRITFLDTPGHEAFTAMRARGASTTDIVVLVVAADDGVNAQTVEAINHAKAAKAPLIVAINKIDLPSADPHRVRNELLQHGLVVEEMGGDILSVEVSAKQKTNLGKLCEAILLQTELLELNANPDRRAEGVVIEAKMEKGRGAVATVLVQKGSLAVGDVVIAGTQWGKIRALLDDRGQRIGLAGPSAPVEILGLTGTPMAGDVFVVAENEARAREVTNYRSRERRAATVAGMQRGSVEQMLNAASDNTAKELAVVIKSDVHGSTEAIQQSLEKLGDEEVKLRVLHAGIGGINESDVTLAEASNALIIGFNVRANPQARDLARQGGIDIRYYTIIYHVIDDVKAILSGMLTPDLEETILGLAEIRKIFHISKIGRVAGCRVREGLVQRGAKARLLRDQVVVYEGALSSLRREKDEVREVKEGYECGIWLENYGDVQEGDLIECYTLKEIARTL